MPKHEDLKNLPNIERRLHPEVWRALQMAATAHEGIQRKDGRGPYVVHLYETLTLVEMGTSDLATRIAAPLHDGQEDVPDKLGLTIVAKEFGDEAAMLVAGVTKRPKDPNAITPDEKRADWFARNQDYAQRLEFKADERSSIIAVADKISNLRDMIRNTYTKGDSFWSKFNATPEDQLWWYKLVYDVAQKRIPDNPLNTIFAASIVEFEFAIKLYRSK
jgi:(p)ppGpp synthase/HD superfamily hydrolase